MKNRTAALVGSVASVLCVFVTNPGFGQGSLAPPGPPAATMQTLDQLGGKADQANTKLDQNNTKLDQIEAKVEKRLPIAATGATIFITVSGSYYLTANITFTGNGLMIGGDNITVDLNGFSLIGPGTGANNGITISGAHKNIVIRNGIIRSFGGSGISGSSGDNMTIERITATDNGPSPASGIRVGTNCRITDCTATGNFNGVYADNDAVITRVVANSNSNNGLVAGSGGTVQFSSASKNGNFGIQVGNDVSVSHCSASANTARGITAADGCVITNCVAAVDGAYAIYTEKSGHVSQCDTRASAVGIRVGDGSMITSCTASTCTVDGMQGTNYCSLTNNDSSNNGTFPTNSVPGIHLFGLSNRVDSNHAMHNSGFGIVTTADQTLASADIIIRNTAHANFAGNYSPSSGQFIGPTNQNPSTSTSPWANF